jgi:hypothetical protein
MAVKLDYEVFKSYRKEAGIFGEENGSGSEG